ncbi:transpeptidase family protein [bacterium SCSIO 12741]|nr:transpeptidase family protein [bacterium SCSIO 12741]
MANKGNTSRRFYTIYLLLVVFGLAIVYKIIVVQYVQGDEWKEMAHNHSLKYKTIEAIRGNVYATDGSLLATSIPKYEVRFDCVTEALTDKIWEEEIDSLSYHLSTLLNHKSQGQWREELQEARDNGKRYHLIGRNLNYTHLKELRSFPIFKKGQYKGGFIYLQQNKREKPFQVLASRTIGYSRNNAKPVGLEGAYDQTLSGVSGVRLMQKIGGGNWKPVTDDNEIEPEDGSDIYTTLDMNIQDVAENALMEQLAKQEADHGCVVLMEVKTGEVRAIANLTRTPSGNYWESYNYAVGESTEPGSTFKLASLIVALEDGYIDLDDSVKTGRGVFKFYDQKMYDSHKGGFGTVTVKHGFEVSSNIMVARIINENYSKSPQQFIDRLYKMNLNQPLGLEIYGEGTPQIKSASDPSWSGISLPWISHGYEVALTPLQILTFYNAVANDGVMVKPRFVNEIRTMGKVIRTFEPEVINPAICSKATINKARTMLEGVVENGTARNLKNSDYKIAGKTGTAQIYNAKYGYKYASKVSYQASFVGYFPADDPMYSCIVVVNAPSKNVYYGNLVAGPIFKEIADKVYATSIQLHEELKEQQEFTAQTRIPVSRNGNREDLDQVFNTIDVDVNRGEDPGNWVATSTGSEDVTYYNRSIKDGLVPNVVGMDIRDAIFLVENLGMRVEFEGRGVIREQIPKPGSRIDKNGVIKLKLT